jgi:hypothetical protein
MYERVRKITINKISTLWAFCLLNFKAETKNKIITVNKLNLFEYVESGRILLNLILFSIMSVNMYSLIFSKFENFWIVSPEFTLKRL